MIGRATINEYADDAKTLAMQRRNAGKHTGKLAAGHAWKRPEETDAHEMAAISCLARLRITVDQIRDAAFVASGGVIEDLPF